MIEMPSPNEAKVRFTLYSSPRFTVFGDLYSHKRLFLHLDWPHPKMTPSVYKEMVNAVAMMKNAAKKSEIDRLYILVDESLVKFESMLGFKIDNLYMREGQPNMVLMSQETT